MFSKKSPTRELSEQNFKDIFFEIFSKEIKKKDVHAVYSYFIENKGHHLIYYAETRKPRDFLCDEDSYKWFSQREIIKLNIPEQVKHDITIGFRVIESSIRKKLGERTID